MKNRSRQRVIGTLDLVNAAPLKRRGFLLNASSLASGTIRDDAIPNSDAAASRHRRKAHNIPPTSAALWRCFCAVVAECGVAIWMSGVQLGSRPTIAAPEMA